jgi:dihydroorotate dehydrogenase
VISIGSISLQHALYLSAGCAKYPADAQMILDSPSAALVVGSISTLPYGEDVGDTLWCDGARSVTGFGYPNPGMDAWEPELRKLADAARSAGKPLIVNVAGNDAADYLDLAERAIASGASAVELNLSWPALLNRRGTQKYAFADEPDAVAGLLQQAAARLAGKRGELWLKFPPLQPTTLERMADVIRANERASVTAVVCCGPYPKTLFLDAANESVLGTTSFGQVGGDFLRPIALGQVRQFRSFLPSKVAVIGVGGVSIRAHVDQFLAMGASAVGMTTAYKIGGAEIFSYLFPAEDAAEVE